jgi:lysophospholipase L1-like esterase
MLVTTQKTVSVYGDSISTLAGVSPEDGVFYDPNFARNTGVSSAEDTWWMKVIRGLGASLLVNNSYAGSTVCRNGYQAASTPWRIAKLRKGDLLPDYILIYSGLNDVAFYRSPDEFYMDYASMLAQMKEAYPQTEICCGTLCQGFLNNPNWPLFVNLKECRPLSLYNEGIRRAVHESGCRLADLADFEQAYSSIDGVHPDAKGMELLAGLWLRSLLP